MLDAILTAYAYALFLLAAVLIALAGEFVVTCYHRARRNAAIRRHNRATIR